MRSANDQGDDTNLVIKAIREQCPYDRALVTGPAGDDETDAPPPNMQPNTLRFVFNRELQEGWPSDSDTLIEPGTTVELDLWGDGPEAYYQAALAAWWLTHTTGLEDGASGIERVVEMIEEDERPPEDVEHWVSIIGRVMSAVLPSSQSPVGPSETEYYALTMFAEFVARSLLRALRDHSPLDVEKVMLLQLARMTREYGVETDAAIASDRFKESRCEEVDWEPLSSWDFIDYKVMDSDNSDDVLLAIIFAAAKVGIDLGTLELGFIRDGFAIRAIRGVVQ
jgi:hypothetical protein